MCLEHELVDQLHRHFAEVRQQVPLDSRLATGGRSFFPSAALAQRKKPVAGEPVEGDDAPVGSRLSTASGPLRDDFKNTLRHQLAGERADVSLFNSSQGWNNRIAQ